MLYMYQGMGAKREPDCLVSAELIERFLHTSNTRLLSVFLV